MKVHGGLRESGPLKFRGGGDEHSVLKCKFRFCIGKNVEKCIFLPQKDYGEDQPITCSHFEGDEAQREKGGERVKKKGERERENKRERGRKER